MVAIIGAHFMSQPARPVSQTKLEKAQTLAHDWPSHGGRFRDMLSPLQTILKVLNCSFFAITTIARIHSNDGDRKKDG